MELREKKKIGGRSVHEDIPFSLCLCVSFLLLLAFTLYKPFDRFIRVVLKSSAGNRSVCMKVQVQAQCSRPPPLHPGPPFFFVSVPLSATVLKNSATMLVRMKDGWSERGIRPSSISTDSEII